MRPRLSFRVGVLLVAISLSMLTSSSSSIDTWLEPTRPESASSNGEKRFPLIVSLGSDYILLLHTDHFQVTRQDVQDAIDGPLAHWMTHGMLQAAFRDSQIQQTVDLTNATGARGDILTSTFYLEDNQWNFGTALQQWRYDDQARASVRRPRRTVVDWNRHLDRRPATYQDDFDHQKLVIRAKKHKKWTQHEYIPGIGAQNEAGKAKRRQFAITEPKDLLRINRWRNRVVRRIPEYPLSKTGRTSDGQNTKQIVGNSWHPLERRYLENLYKSRFQDVEATDPDWFELVDRLNQAFEHVFLPGSLHHAPQRDRAQLTGYMHRRWLKQVKSGKPKTKGREALRLIEAEQETEVQQLEKSLDAGVASTLDDVNAVENEPEPGIAEDGYPLEDGDFEKDDGQQSIETNTQSDDDESILQEDEAAAELAPRRSKRLIAAEESVLSRPLKLLKTNQKVIFSSLGMKISTISPQGLQQSD